MIRIIARDLFTISKIANPLKKSATCLGSNPSATIVQELE